MTLETVADQDRKTKVLFLCTGNSCRSQMAEGLLRAEYGDKFEAFSAGTRPVAVNPRAIQVMSEAGLDISSHRSQALSDFYGEDMDLVVSVCDAASAVCPDFPGSKRLHWSLPDPAEASGTEAEIIEAFRKVRDDIRSRIRMSLAAG
ncbi:arsenate reductase [Marinobacter sp. MBR-99]|uniref:arsenate reductase ArsC n=1 Tax=Marinobacter sp. MBR-99 TaxID=3156461 RepID=UPI003394A1FA